jgi:hypothetical protein
VGALEAQQLGQFAMTRPSFWHEVRASLVTAELPVGERAMVLDIGAGGGMLGAVVRRDRPEAHYRFVEPLEAVAARLEVEYGSGARVVDLAVADIGAVDVFALLDVLEHFEDPVEFLRPVVDRARAGATFVLTMPAMPILWSSWDEQIGHFRRYTRATARGLAEAVGLVASEVAYLFPELVPLGLVRRMLRSVSATHSQGADFPSLPRPVDRALLTVGRLTSRARRWWPVGTSVVVIATRPQDHSRGSD